jgi:hypothetical protein
MFEMPDETQTPDQTDNRARRPFASWLTEQRNGALHAELTEAKPSAEGYHLFVADNVKVSKPEGERPAALYFHDGQGNLSRRDPNQLTLDQPLRTIDGGKVDPDTGEVATGDAQ